MEDLTKHQIILLCLLLSFITSIGTGVITFSLLNEAPPAVTQTINRIVEKTIERVVPVDNQANVRQVTVRETVVVKEEDLIISAIDKNSGALVRIKNALSPQATTVLYGLGFLVSKDGTIVAPRNLEIENGFFTAEFSNGTVVELKAPVVSIDKNFVFFMPVDIKTVASVVPANFGDADSLKLGQSIIVLGGKEKNTVTLGRVSALNTSSPAVTATSTPEIVKNVVSIETDVVPLSSVPGEILLNLSGEVVGINFPPLEAGHFFPGENIQKSLESFIKTPQNNNP